jgi:hypothetical protein
MEQKGLLTLKDTNGVASVTSIQRVHDLFRGVKVQDPEALRQGTKGVRAEEKEKKDREGSKVSVLELYKMPKKLR